MFQYKNIAIFVLIFVSFQMIPSAFALSNKESVIQSINTLNTLIISSIDTREKNLSDRANELGNRYDNTIKSLGFQSEEVEALTSIKKLGVASFRQDIAQAYLDLKQKLLQNIKTTQLSLVSLRDEIALGYTELSIAQKQTYEEKINEAKKSLDTFLSGSTSSIDNFTATFSGRIAPDSILVSNMMKENGPYIVFIRDIRYNYARINEKLSILLAQKSTLEKNILPKIQGGFLIFTDNKKVLTHAIRNDLISGLEKALMQERLKKQEGKLRAYVEDIMSKWNEHLQKNFGQDDELISATKDLANVLIGEKNLRDRIYDTAGNIQSLDISGSGILLNETAKIDARIATNNVVISSIIGTYSTGNALTSLNDKLIESYKTELIKYRSDLTKLLEEKLNSALLQEKNNIQALSLLDKEEQILKQSLETVSSVEFTKELVNNFIIRIQAISQSSGQENIARKVQMLIYRHTRTITRKKIEDTVFIPYYSRRNSLDIALNNLFLSLEKKSGKEVLLQKFPTISAKIDTLLANPKLSLKNQYTLLVVQSHILTYLEDATK